jgi:hypothetical protein
MFSSAEQWRGGNRIGWIPHAGAGPHHLEERGPLPIHSPAMNQRLMAAQQTEDEQGGEVDCRFQFKVPLEQAESIAGFKPDQAVDLPLERLQPFSGRGFLSQWLRAATTKGSD